MTHTQQDAATPLDIKDFDRDALFIIKTLQQRGFTAYLVGGCVRDLLLGKSPKDFDIATNARPQDVRRLIHNAFIIGKRFRLVLVKRGDVQFEVSTFRRDARPDEDSEKLPAGDNLFGSPEEDAKRRDFTINALFYDPSEHKLIDYANGLADLNLGLVRMIGAPDVRLVEDPIRIMRGIRLAHMIRFSLDSDLRAAIRRHAGELSNTALPRRREEILKYLRLENPALPLLTSLDLGVMDYVSPHIAETLRDTAKNELFLKYLFHFHEKKLSTPVELFAGLVFSYYMSQHSGELTQDLHTHDILDDKNIAALMRDELGMFKSEQVLVAKAMHLMMLFLRRKEFEGRGERRRNAIIENEAFPLAVKLAEREHWLTPKDLYFWQTECARVMARPAKSGSERTGNRRRPRRRRPKNPAKNPQTAN